jgi:hypothetical protein
MRQALLKMFEENFEKKFACSSLILSLLLLWVDRDSVQFRLTAVEAVHKVSQMHDKSGTEEVVCKIHATLQYSFFPAL